MKLKICNRCKAEKDISEFYERKKGSGSYDANCKVCRRDMNKESRLRHPKTEDEKKAAVAHTRKWREENPEKARETAARDRLNRSPERVERDRIRMREWREKKRFEKFNKVFDIMSK